MCQEGFVQCGCRESIISKGCKTKGMQGGVSLIIQTVLKKNPGSRVPLCSVSVSIFSFSLSSVKQWLSGKEPACNAGDVGSIPGSGDPLEKEMATHSSTLAWRSLWTEEPGGATVHGVAEELDRTE